ncbi:src kinase-associated phosphoprotein 2 isoform X2 [Gadus morhua]|uniref:src kinase-associated phosphoprotein 2 isoform X2 n=1 Tax=Gadus morhua TaxID=8049 RepID=UPI0011B521BA|nr:src kinase-associated phosphoprotein 2 isoform X2 [Gadus morhua]
MRYEELTTLVSDLETFLNDGLKGENLSKKAKEKKEAFIKRIKEVKLGFPQDFKEKSGEDSGEEDESDSHNDGGSMHSERTDKDEEASEGVQQAPAIAAQDLPYVFKAGYLEKRRKEHSFFGTEWQKRWCALSSNTFYYYGNEKDKQQKGEFSIDGYIVKLNHTLRKDSKKECCFEISASDKRVYQTCRALYLKTRMKSRRYTMTLSRCLRCPSTRTSMKNFQRRICLLFQSLLQSWRRQTSLLLLFQLIRAPTTPTSTRVSGIAQETYRMSCPSGVVMPFIS